MPVRSMNSVLAEATSRDSINGTRIVGVDGPSGSGKSTLAERLARLSGAPLIHIDDFVSWSDFAGWWPRFDREVLTPLLAGKPAHFQVRDWANDEYGTSLNGWKTVPWAPLVIIEGVTSTRAEGAARVAYRIWVEAPEPVRLQRGMERDSESHRHLWLNWIRAEAEFFARDRTRERADLAVIGAPDVPHDSEREIVVSDEQ